MSPRDRNRAKAQHRLADMSSPETVSHYTRPADAVMYAFPIELDRTSTLYVEDWHLRGRTVWFVLVQLFKPEDDASAVEISRIDCSHGSVHEHRFDADGHDVLQRRVIADLSCSNPGESVHAAYPGAYNDMLDNWQKNLDLWRQT
jgi:hypothetical protein